MLVVFASLLLLASAQICPPYACAPPGMQPGNNVCQVPLSNSTQLSICPNLSPTYGCVESFSPNATSSCGQILVLPEPLLPGQSCSAIDQCFGYPAVKCIESICVGLGEDLICYDDRECGIGLFCNGTGTTATCQSQLDQGEDCTSDAQCLNQYGCSGTIEAPGVCTSYFSIPTGQPVNNCVDNGGEGISNLCATGACNITTIGEPAGVCVINGISPSMPVSCQAGSFCTGKVGPVPIQKSCVCGYSASGTNGFCPLFSGDLPASTVRATLQAVIKTTAFNACHTSGRFENYCIQNGLDNASEYQLYLENLDLVANYPLYQNNDNCAKANLLNSYYQLTEASFACPAYSCYGGSGWVQNTCVAYNQGNNTYELQTCAQNNLCDVSNLGSANVTCQSQPPPTPLQYAGGNCSGNSSCVSQNCQNSVCVGLLSGSSCTDSSYCDLALYCNPNSTTCVPLLTVNSPTQCVTDSECVLNAGCNYFFNQTTAGAKCVQYNTITEGSGVRCPVSGYSALCATNMCMNLNLDYGICVQPAVSAAATLPQNCTQNSDCIGYNNPNHNMTFYSQCTCGYNPTGQSYCQLFPGDTPYVKYLALLNMLVTSSNANNICQTTRRFQPDCLTIIEQAAGENGNGLVLSYYNSTQFSQLQNNDACTKNTVTSYYWNYVTPVHPNPNPANNTSAPVYGLAAGVMLLTFI